MLSKIRNARGFTLIELMIVVAILAILSVVAVPAFIKYMRKAKTSEAIDMLDKIYKGASDYYATPRVKENTAEKLECQFPVSQDPTPVEQNCCSGGGKDNDADDRCDEDAEQWSTASWAALKFQINEQHYFWYAFSNNGEVGSAAQFTADAHADLDCDGTPSTFQKYGKGDPAAKTAECSIVSAAALFSNNETE
jgi:prepilin-type N-terminal cleavage/methylation domain-containing protein